MTNLDSVLKSRDVTLPPKVHFSSSHVWMWELDNKKVEGWRTDAFELWRWRKLLRVPWTARRSNQSILKEISPEYSLEALMLKLKLPILWPPDVKNWLIGKDPDAGKDWRREEKGTTEDEMVGWHHRFNGHELMQALGDGEGQESLVCCSPWGHKQSDTIWRLTSIRTRGEKAKWLWHVWFIWRAGGILHFTLPCCLFTEKGDFFHFYLCAGVF